MKPNRPELIQCMQQLAAAMGQALIPTDLANQLIEYILYGGRFRGSKGQTHWASYTGNLITQRELRNVFMAHAATRISQINQQTEPSADLYLNQPLCVAFEIALLGQPAAIDSDIPDPWE